MIKNYQKNIYRMPIPVSIYKLSRLFLFYFNAYSISIPSIFLLTMYIIPPPLNTFTEYTFRYERLYILSYCVTHAHILIVRRNSFHTVMRDCVDRFLYAFWFLCLYPYGCNIGCFKIDLSDLSLYRVCQ